MILVPIQRYCCFFFSSRRRHTRCGRDWSSDVCSSDLIKAFAVAILGGIGNAWGVVLAGLIYGIAEALIIALAGSTYSQIATFALVILALAIRPTGLFGHAEVKKV